MVSISVQLENRHEGTSNFNTWKARVLSILEEHDLDACVTSMSEEPLSNAGWIQEKVNMHNFHHFLGDKFHGEFMINPWGIKQNRLKPTSQMGVYSLTMRGYIKFTVIWIWNYHNFYYGRFPKVDELME